LFCFFFYFVFVLFFFFLARRRGHGSRRGTSERIGGRIESG
jgi:hypothetical protein